MAAKWIIIKDEFRLGNVGLHEDLIGDLKRTDVLGGGSFTLDSDPENKRLILFGHSFDFGSCQTSDFDKVSKWVGIPDRWKNLTIQFTDEAGEITIVKKSA